jgi:tripeptide aminopeptidase
MLNNPEEDIMNQSIQTMLDLIVIPGQSTQEEEISRAIRKILIDIGVPENCIQSDETYAQSEYGGATGNLIVRLDGTGEGERIMLSTHMDTVPSAVGCKPRVDVDKLVNDAPERALGGDARAGCACLFAAIRALLEKNGYHSPRTFVFFVQEELGLVGARGLDVGMLGDPKPVMAFNFDGGFAHRIATRVIGTERMNIKISGVPAHGGRPKQGISAAVIAARAIAEMEENGWHGAVEKPEGTGFTNMGVLKGGKNSNIVMPEMIGLIEARSFDLDFRKTILDTWRDAFSRSVDVQNEKSSEALGTASVEFSPGPMYSPYHLAEDEPVVRRALEAARKFGLEPELVDFPGGMDSCHITAKGIPCVGIGIGDREAHSKNEWVDIPDFLNACAMAVDLAVY